MPRKPEQAFWDKVRPLLAGLHPVRIENSVAMGTPDVNCSLGWIELKVVQAKDIPKKADTILSIDHYTEQQRVFQLKRNRAGGACWFLLLLGEMWLLFTSQKAVIDVGRHPVEGTKMCASRIWARAPSKEAFQKALHETCSSPVVTSLK